MAEQCHQCGTRPSAYRACAHVVTGEVKDIQIKENRATCKACSKLIPDESFSGLCVRCLDRLQAPADLEEELAALKSEEDEVSSLLDQLKPKIEAISARKRELQRHLIADKLEELLAGLQELLGFFSPKGAVYIHHEKLRQLVEQIKMEDSSFPGSLSSSMYNAVVNRQDSTVAALCELVRNGGLEPETSLARLLARIFKNADTYFKKEQG